MFKCILTLIWSVFSVLALAAGDGRLLAEWDFTGKNAEKNLSLRGKSKIQADCLIIPLDQKRSPAGAVSGNADFPHLENSFSIEAEILPDPHPDYTHWRMILDKKYIALPRNKSQKMFHNGLMFFLIPRGGNTFRMGAAFGYGNSSCQIASKNFTLPTARPSKLKLYYDAAGKAEFFLNGRKVSTHSIPALPLTGNKFPAILGDRRGANYYPLGGRIRKIVIKKEPYSPIAFAVPVSRRKVFERGELNPSLPLTVQNLLPGKWNDLTIKAATSGKKFEDIKIPQLAGKEKKTFPIFLDPFLLPGKYELLLTLLDGKGKTLAREKISYHIVPARKDFLPVILWGNYEDIREIRKAGFTHQMVHLFPKTGNFNPAALPKWISHLDDNLKEGLYTFGNLHGHFRFLQQERYLRKDKSGKRYPRKNIEASNPAVRKEFALAAESTLAQVGGHPAFDGVLLNSEVRDSALPSYAGGIEPEAFRKFSGYDIPGTISGKSPPPYKADPDFPWDRVISSKRKDYVFLKWFYLTGDGWNDLQTHLSAVIHKSIRNFPGKKHFFTFYDPATRVPPLWGSGGNVDMIAQWTYTYPDPIKIGQATDELIAMAQGKKGQKIGSMTQAIWYRSQTAPLHIKVKNPPSWLSEEKEAAFISISPDNLREAFWSKMARRLDAIMYHGVGSLLAKTDHKLYRYTNNQSKKVLAELVRDVVIPLGPTLKKIPEKPAKIAIFQNLASSFYAPGHFSFGWSKNWQSDLHLALQWGGFQPGILYDEHLMQNKNRSELKVLFVPGLEVVTEEILEKLNHLREKGVVLIGDEFTLPALMVDWRIRSIPRNADDPAGTKKALQKLGKEMAELLKKYDVREACSSNNDIVVRMRGDEKANVLFILNDKRTFGDYVGMWKKVQEKGLPSSGVVTVPRKWKAAYDLVQHREVPLQETAVGSRLAVKLAPGDGKAILLLPDPIAAIELKITSRPAAKGGKISFVCEVKDGKKRTIPAVLPLAIELAADNGLQLPGSGFYAAENGKLEIKEILPTNLSSSVKNLILTAKCLSSGKKAAIKIPLQ